MEESFDQLDFFFGDRADPQDSFLNGVDNLMDEEPLDGIVTPYMAAVGLEKTPEDKNEPPSFVKKMPVAQGQVPGLDKQNIGKAWTGSNFKAPVDTEPLKEQNSKEVVDAVFRECNNRKEATEFEEMIRKASGAREPLVFDEKMLAVSTKAHGLVAMLQEITRQFGQSSGIQHLSTAIEAVALDADRRIVVEPEKCKKPRMALQASEPNGYIRFHTPTKDLTNRLSRSASNVSRLSQKKGAALFKEVFKGIGQKIEVELIDVELKVPSKPDYKEGKLLKVFDCKTVERKVLILEALYDVGPVADMILFNSLIKLLSEKLFSAVKSEISAKHLNYTEAFLQKIKIYNHDQNKDKNEADIATKKDKSDSSVDEPMNLLELLENKEEELLLRFNELYSIDPSNLYEMVERLFLKYPKINSIRLEELLRRTDFFYFEAGTRQLVNGMYRIMLHYIQRVKIVELFILRTKQADESLESAMVIESKTSGRSSEVKRIVYHDLSMLLFAEGITAMSLVFDHLLEKVSMKNLLRMLRSTGDQPLLEYKPANKKQFRGGHKKNYAEMVPRGFGGSDMRYQGRDHRKANLGPKPDNKIVNELGVSPKGGSPLSTRTPQRDSPIAEKRPELKGNVRISNYQVELPREKEKSLLISPITFKKNESKLSQFQSQPSSKPRESEKTQGLQRKADLESSRRRPQPMDQRRNFAQENDKRLRFDESGTLGKRQPLREAEQPQSRPHRQEEVSQGPFHDKRLYVETTRPQKDVQSRHFELNSGERTLPASKTSSPVRQIEDSTRAKQAMDLIEVSESEEESEESSSTEELETPALSVSNRVQVYSNRDCDVEGLEASQFGPAPAGGQSSTVKRDFPTRKDSTASRFWILLQDDEDLREEYCQYLLDKEQEHQLSVREYQGPAFNLSMANIVEEISIATTVVECKDRVGVDAGDELEDGSEDGEEVQEDASAEIVEDSSEESSAGGQTEGQTLPISYTDREKSRTETIRHTGSVSKAGFRERRESSDQDDGRGFEGNGHKAIKGVVQPREVMDSSLMTISAGIYVEDDGEGEEEESESEEDEKTRESELQPSSSDSNRRLGLKISVDRNIDEDKPLIDFIPNQKEWLLQRNSESLSVQFSPEGSWVSPVKIPSSSLRRDQPSSSFVSNKESNTHRFQSTKDGTTPLSKPPKETAQSPILVPAPTSNMARNPSKDGKMTTSTESRPPALYTARPQIKNFVADHYCAELEAKVKKPSLRLDALAKVASRDSRPRLLLDCRHLPGHSTRLRPERRPQAFGDLLDSLEWTED